MPPVAAWPKVAFDKELRDYMTLAYNAVFIDDFVLSQFSTLSCPSVGWLYSLFFHNK